PRSSPERPPPQGWRPRARGTPQESRPLPAGAGGSGPGPQKGGATRRSVARAARGPPSGHTAPTPAGAVPASPEHPANRQRGNRGRKGPSAPPPHLAVASFPPSPLAAGAARRQIVTISFSNRPQAPGPAMPGPGRRRRGHHPDGPGLEGEEEILALAAPQLPRVRGHQGPQPATVEAGLHQHRVAQVLGIDQAGWNPDPLAAIVEGGGIHQPDPLGPDHQ